MRICGMHERANIRLSAADHRTLAAVVANRNSPQKHVWRAKIILLTAKGHGTAEIMRATRKAKTVVWRWQERFRDKGAAGFWRDKTRPGARPIGIDSKTNRGPTFVGCPNSRTTHGTSH